MPYPNAAICGIFGLPNTPSRFINAEKEGRIPESKREKRGKQSIRVWDDRDIPLIGAKYGFLEKPVMQIIIATQYSKGGILKTTLSANLAKALALNNIKTLVIGLDTQQSITNLLLGLSAKATSIDDFKYQEGLYEVIIENRPIDSVVIKTNYPTLDVLPENKKISALNSEISRRPRMVDVLKERLIPLLSSYQAIVFDCSSQFSELTQNALVASPNFISPIGCDIGSFQTLDENQTLIKAFAESTNTKWTYRAWIPVLLENNCLSKDILGRYQDTFGRLLESVPIRRTVIAQEASCGHLSVFEYAPRSELADDYRNLFKSMWSKINSETPKEVHHS